MPSFSYYEFKSVTGFGFDCCNRKSEELPIMVNCAGQYQASSDFSTDRREGRKDWYLLFVTDGELQLNFDGNKQIATVGTAVVYPPKTHYCYSGKISQNTEYLWVHFTGSFVEKLLSDLGVVKTHVVQTVQSPASVKHSFNKLFKQFLSNDNIRQHRLAAALYEIITTALAVKVRDNNGNENPLSKSIAYIHTNFQHKITVPQLAKCENLSVSRYNTLFRKFTGTNPTGYLLNLRINSACELLIGTELSVCRVAELTGYDDSRFFCKVFKREVGVTPSEYRKSRCLPSMVSEV